MQYAPKPPKPVHPDVVRIREKLKPIRDEANVLRKQARQNMRQGVSDVELTGKLRVLEEQIYVMMTNIARLKRGKQ